MDKVELANKLYKINQGIKKNTLSLENMEKKFRTTKDSVDLSSKTISPDSSEVSKKITDIRMDLVNKYKADITQGTYKVKTDEIAEKIIQKYKEQTYYKPYF